jgi:sugar phosphate isomerase/epimerase
MNALTGQLSLCWGSMEGVELVEFLDAAANAGFHAVTLNSPLYENAISTGLSDKDIGHLLEDNNLRVSGIDPLFNWLPSSINLGGDDIISRCTRATIDEIFHIAHIAGTDLINAPLGLATPESEQQIIDCFAALCERASKEKLRVSLEFMPFNKVSDLATAARIVTQAGFDNGGIMLDCWHHHRSGGTADDILNISPELFFALQLDDAMSHPMEDILEETLNHRLLPGEGCIDLVRTLGNLKDIGAKLVYDVEVFKAPLRSRSPKERANLMFKYANAVVQCI